jgi:hypothetical protein
MPAQNGSQAAYNFKTLGDPVSNIGRFKIIESTLREGEQFASAFFDTETKIKMYDNPIVY